MGFDRLRQRNEQSLFYRNAYRKLTNAALFLAFINVLMLIYIIYGQFTRPDPLYFATTMEGRLIPLQPTP